MADSSASGLSATASATLTVTTSHHHVMAHSKGAGYYIPKILLVQNRFFLGQYAILVPAKRGNWVGNWVGVGIRAYLWR